MHASSGLLAVVLISANAFGQPAPASSPRARGPVSTDVVTHVDKQSITAHVRTIVQDKQGNMWFGTDGEGICLYDGKTFRYFAEKEGLPNNFVRTIQEDTEGNLWITTRDGLCRFDGKKFERIEAPLESPIGDNSFAARAPGPDALWFPAVEGAHVYDGKTLRYLAFPVDAADVETRRARGDLNPYDTYSVYRDRAGNIWIGTANRGVCRYDWKSFAWFRDVDLDKSAVRAIFEDSRGDMWFGNSGVGLFRYDGKELRNFGDDNKIGNRTWLHRGLIRMPGTIGDPHAITEDGAGNLWIGAFDSGAWRYDGKDITNFTTKDGLNVDSVSAIYKDRAGKMWFGTYKGVCTFDGMTFNAVAGPSAKPENR
ncbi:MAG: ligand-binding sensor domain-containing protein [Phycisphaerales bacterium]